MLESVLSRRLVEGGCILNKAVSFLIIREEINGWLFARPVVGRLSADCWSCRSPVGLLLVDSLPRDN